MQYPGSILLHPAYCRLYTTRRSYNVSHRIPRVGVGGPVGSGKTALIEALVPMLLAEGYAPLVITNDIVTREDAEHVKRTLAAVRDDPTMNLAAVAELEQRYPDADILLLESGGDNLTLSFSRALVDYFIFVIDVAGGDKIPRKRGPGLIQADLLVINKTDLAPYVGASLEVMEHDSRLVRGERPFLFTNCRSGEGLGAVLDTIKGALLQNAELRIQN